jgi:hypothetical protein
MQIGRGGDDGGHEKCGMRHVAELREELRNNGDQRNDAHGR